MNIIWKMTELESPKTPIYQGNLVGYFTDKGKKNFLKKNNGCYYIQPIKIIDK